MTLDQLKYFSAAATFQHVGRAANSVAISASVISAAIASLEKELGRELFSRKGRNIYLTTDGEKLLKRAQSILSEVNSLKGFLQQKPSSLEGKYRLAASHFLASTTLLKGVSDLLEENENLCADIYSMNTAAAIGELISGRIDLAICFSPLRHPDISEHVIHKGTLQFVVRKGHPILTESARAQVKFLAETPAIIHKSSQLVETCEQHPVFSQLGFQPKINMSFDSDHTAVQRVLSSNAWSFLPDVVVNEYSKIRPILISATAKKALYHISALVHRQNEHHTVLKKVIEALA